jgi:protoporphyrinogen oxidase
VQYLGVICASLLLKNPLAGFYVTNITDDGFPFTGVIEMSALVDRAQFGGRCLVYLPKYVDPDDPAFALSDDELQRQFLAALARIHPTFRRDDLLCFKVSRVRRVFALSTLGYSRRLPAMATSLPGLHVVNSAHILNGTLNVNETLQLAERAAAKLLAEAGAEPS